MRLGMVAGEKGETIELKPARGRMCKRAMSGEVVHTKRIVEGEVGLITELKDCFEQSEYNIVSVFANLC
jgi:hypothetical protein